ncbi:MAG: hypothetical protein WAN05_19630, partial [Roseiarcus sp.]
LDPLQEVKRSEGLFARCRADLGSADAMRLECGNVVGLDFRRPALLAAASFEGCNLGACARRLFCRGS